MAYSDVVLSYSPASYWKLDDRSGTTAVDQMSAANGTYEGSPQLLANRLVENDTGSAIFLSNSLGNGVNMGNVYDFTGSSAFTVLCWIRLRTYNSGSGHSIWSNEDTSARGWSIRLANPSVTIIASRGDNAGFDNVSVQVTAAFLQQQIHMIGIWFDGTNLRIRLDNGFVATGVSSKSLVAATTNTNLKLGKFSGGGSGFDGSIDEAAIWSSALSDAAMSEIYKAGLAQYVPAAPPVLAGWGAA